MGRKKLYTDEELRAHKKKYYLKNKERLIAENTKRIQATVARRRELLREFPCRACGLNEPDVIQWHHYNPEEKEFELFRTAWKEEQFWDEVLKCVPLCANCHVKIHRNLLCLIPPHQLMEWEKLRKKNRTESKPQLDTGSTYVPASTCQASQLFSQQLNPKNLNKDSSNGSNEIQVPSKRQAPGVLPFT